MDQQSNNTPPPAPQPVPQPTVVVNSDPTIDDRIKALYDNHRSVFWILIPLIVVVVLVLTFRDLVLAFLIGDSRKITQEAQKQDAQLQAQANAANTQADQSKAQADQIDKNIQDRKESDVSEDWYKKGS